MTETKRGIPDKPGHYWYIHPGGKRTVLEVTKMEGREAWTTINGYGIKVVVTPGIWELDRVEDM